MKRLVLRSATLVAATAALAFAGGPMGTAAATNPNPCSPLWTDPSGDVDSHVDTSNGSTLDLLKGTMTMSGPSTLAVRLYVADMELPAASLTTANEYRWRMFWTDASTGLSHVATALYRTDGTTSFTDGAATDPRIEPTGPTTTDTGSFVTGPGGYVEIDVPLSHLGSPAVGTILSQPVGTTNWLLTDSSTQVLDASNSGLTTASADTGGPQYDYSVGQTCA